MLFAQLALKELADSRTWNRVDEDDTVGDHPLDDALADPGLQGRLVERLTLADYNDGNRTLDPLGVRQSDDCRFLYNRMAHDQVLEIDARDPLAARFDEILRTVDQLQVPVRVDRADVARVEPAIFEDRQFFVDLVVARRHRRPAHPERARSLTVARDVVAVIVEQLPGHERREASLF